MPDAPALPDLAALAAVVRLEDDPAAAFELVQRLPLPLDPRPVSVTDLLNPRQAFWRKLRGPAPVPVEREARLEEGRRWHHRLGEAIPTEGRLEVRVRRGGVTARIDLLTDVPVEVKTAPASPGGGRPVDWPDQLEQLAAYCALAGSTTGRLAHLTTARTGPPTVTVGEFTFASLPGIDAELARREAGLRAALQRGTPEGLEECRWAESGCEFRVAGLCDCSGREDAPLPPLGELAQGRLDRPELSARWSRALADAPAEGSGTAPRLRELLYPRRAFFDRTAGRPHVVVPARPPSAPLDAYERILAALERGPLGELHRLPSAAGWLGEETVAWRGSPLLVRGSHARARWSANDVVARFPQYAVELGLRCAATDRHDATFVVGHETPAAGEPAVQVFRVTFPGGAGPFEEALRARREALEAALAQEAPGALPYCPRWMTLDCPYRERCGCAPAPGLSQR